MSDSQLWCTTQLGCTCKSCWCSRVRAS
jgi:hypothetical protein